MRPGTQVRATRDQARSELAFERTDSVFEVSVRDRGLSRLWRATCRPSGLLLPIRQVFSSSVLVIVLNVGTGLITARLLGPAGRGELTAMILWPGFVAGLFTLGLQPAITYSLAARRGDPPCLKLVALLLTFCTGLLAAGFGVLAVPIWLKGYSPDVVVFAQWAMLLAPVTLLMQSVNAILVAKGEFRLYNRNKYVPPLISLIALTLLASCGHLSPFSAGLAVLGPPLPLLVANLVWIVSTDRPRFSDPARSFRELLSYGLRSYGIHLATALTKEVDRVVLVTLVSPTALGLYVVAKSLAEPARMLPNAIVTVLFPEASRKTTTEAVALLARASWASTTITCIVALGLAVVAPTLLVLLYGEEFAPAIGPFRILLISAVVAGLEWILAQALMSSGRPGLVTIMRFLSLLVSVGCILLLVPVLGVSGAALAVLASSIVRLVFILFCFPLILKVRSHGLLQPPDWLMARPRGMR